MLSATIFPGIRIMNDPGYPLLLEAEDQDIFPTMSSGLTHSSNCSGVT